MSENQMSADYHIDAKQRKRVWEGLVLPVERACEEFEIIQGFERGTISITSANNNNNFRSTGTICAALARSFLFDARRIERICNGSKNINIIDRELRKELCVALKPFINVRGVNEHGYDPKKVDGDKNTPRLHISADESGLIDETSFYFGDAETVLMGPVNLYDAYVAIKKLNKEANIYKLRKFSE